MKALIWIATALLFAVAFAGCYTMLAHPRVEATEDYGDYEQGRRHCSDCHGSADYYYWHYPNYFNWYWNYRSWRSYYYDPWWWRDYWYCCDDDYEGAPVEKGERHLWQPVERPTDTPGLAPGPEIPKIKDDGSTVKDQPAAGTQQSVSQQKDKAARHLWRPVKRPSEPKKPEPKEQKAEEKK